MKESKNSDIFGLSFGTINFGLSGPENLLYGKLHNWAGGKGWWLGEDWQLHKASSIGNKLSIVVNEA